VWPSMIRDCNHFLLAGHRPKQAFDAFHIDLQLGCVWHAHYGMDLLQWQSFKLGPATVAKFQASNLSCCVITAVAPCCAADHLHPGYLPISRQ